MIVLIGKSGSGKNTVLSYLESLGYTRTVTATTRPMRPGEVKGREYHFLSDDEFDRLSRRGKFAEETSYDMVSGHVRYGSFKKDYEEKEKRAIILNPAGLRAVKEKGIPVKSIYISVPDDVLRKRLIARGDAPDEIERRLAADDRDFSDIEADAIVSVKDGIPEDVVNDMVSDMLLMLGEDIELDDAYEGEEEWT